MKVKDLLEDLKKCDLDANIELRGNTDNELEIYEQGIVIDDQDDLVVIKAVYF